MGIFHTCGHTAQEILLTEIHRLTQYAYEMNVNKVLIEKHQTNEQEDSAYCVIELENEFYQFTKYMKMNYNYDDKGGWILDNYSEYRDTEWKLLGCPLTAEDTAHMCNYSQVEYKETATELENGLVTFYFDVEETHKNGKYKGTAAICCQFDGEEWACNRNIENVHFIWDIVGNQEYHNIEKTSHDRANRPVDSKMPVSYIGKTVGDVKRDFGTDYQVAYFEAAPYISYDTGNAFALAGGFVFPEDITDDIVISNIATTSNEYAVYNFSGAMTYPEIVNTVKGEITLDLPEYYPALDILDSPWDYSLSFTYRGYSLTFGWFDDPETTRSDVLFVERLDFDYEIYQNAQSTEDMSSQQKVSPVAHTPFYGIWCGATITSAVKDRKATGGGKSRTQEVDDAAIFA